MPPLSLKLSSTPAGPASQIGRTRRMGTAQVSRGCALHTGVTRPVRFRIQSNLHSIHVTSQRVNRKSMGTCGAVLTASTVSASRLTTDKFAPPGSSGPAGGVPPWACASQIASLRRPPSRCRVATARRGSEAYAAPRAEQRALRALQLGRAAIAAGEPAASARANADS
jgi:hypothetical protein